LKAALANLDRLNLSIDKKTNFQIRLLITIGNIYKHKEQAIDESVDCFVRALELNDKLKILRDGELAKTTLALGEALVFLNRNREAEKYLNDCAGFLKNNEDHVIDYADNLRFLGILSMRFNDFDGANRYFDEAVGLAGGQTGVEAKISAARACTAKSLNYVNRHINKEGMTEAINLMKKAVNILEDNANPSAFEKNALLRELADCKITLSGMENAEMRHGVALELARETEELLKQLPDEDNASYCSFGKVCTEKGHAYLRMNELEKASEMFAQARKVCDKAQVNEYVWRTRMQQTETLVRLGKLDEAYGNCLYMFNLVERDRNIGADLFYNTCYYHAAVIEHRRGNIPEALEHFKKFSVLMKEFCKEFMEPEAYAKLLNENVFETASDESQIKKRYADALKIFSAICKKGSGFITDYVERNLSDL
jgi:tetratricopeptide (TPR) repeat protein